MLGSPRRFLILAAALALSSTSLVAASPLDDTAAIGAYLSLGLANAPSDFRGITASSTSSIAGMQDWNATAPDSAQFASCSVSHVDADDEDPEEYLYTCYSVPHDESAQALFATVSSAVAQNIPAGYTVGDSETFSQLWSSNTGPSVYVEVKTGEGDIPFYELTMTVYPPAQ